MKLWGKTVGAVSLADAERHAAFQYHPDFLASRLEVAPLMMPLRRETYRFPGLPSESFRGLPGMLADCLPDRFGNALIDAWLARAGRLPAEFNAVERLCYVGTRGIGALEFFPTTGPRERVSSRVDIDVLVELASEILAHRRGLTLSFDGPAQTTALRDLLRVGTSAGGARAKAVIAWNRRTNEVRSGQVPAAEGFEYWLLKFDGVSGNRDKDLDDPRGFGALEYAYSLMATAAGVRMSECHLLEENGRRHFMTRRFDRGPDGEKFHLQSLAAMAHFDFNAAGVHSYEQALVTIRQLGLSMDDIEQQYRRMAFNIIARNQDDHVKNIAFLMNGRGEWSLCPAFDLTYSYNPRGQWTSNHQMSLNGKLDHFTLDDFRAAARGTAMKRGRAETILDEVRVAVRRWPEFADRAGVIPALQEQVQNGMP